MEDKKKNETRQSTMQNRMENMNGQKPKTISIVISVYNEEKALHEFYREATPVFEALPWNYELIFVNDGSADASGQILAELAAADPRVRVINFSRNFGHEAAMLAGLDHSIGEGIVCMDADLQHPPECIPRILEKMAQGYEVISMVRTKNKSAGLVKNITSSGFYWLINHIFGRTFRTKRLGFLRRQPPCGPGVKGQLPGEGALSAGLCPERGLSQNHHRVRGPGQGSGGEQVQPEKAVHFLHQYDPMLLQHAAEAGQSTPGFSPRFWALR